MLKKIYGLMALSLAACGGPSKEAKVATAIQSIMSNLIAGNLEILRGQNANVPCSNSGSFTGSGAFGSFDPATGTGTGTISIVYSSCTYKVCGETVTLSGTDKTQIQFQTTTANTVIMDMQTSDEVFSGVIEGTLSFGYRMTGGATSTSLGAITLSAHPSASPLTLDGKTYNAEELNSLADGC